MIAHTVALRREHDGVAVHHPHRRGVEVARVGEVGESAVGDIEQGDVGVGIMLTGHHLEGYPARVGRPGIGEFAVAVQVGRAVGEPACLARCEVAHCELVAVEYVGELLAVGRHAGHSALMAVGLEHGLLGDEGGVGHIGLVVAGDCGLVDIDAAVALRAVVERARVIAPGRLVLGLRGRGDAPRGGVVGRGDEYVAAPYKGYAVAVGRGHTGTGTATHCHLVNLRGGVGREIDGHLGGLAGAGGKGVQLAVPSEGKASVSGTRQEAHRMGAEVGHRLGLCAGSEGGAVDIDRPAVALAQEVHLAGRAGHGIGVLAWQVGEIGMAPCGGVIEPYVAGHRRGMMLAPLVLKTLDVLVHKLLAARQPAHITGRGAEYLHGDTAAVGCDGVELGHASRGEEGARRRILYGGRVHHGPAVGSPGLGNLRG